MELLIQENQNNAAAGQLKDELQAIGVERFTARDHRPGTVRHIVLFRYIPSVSEAEKAEIERRFMALQSGARPDGRPYIWSIESGAQSSAEGAHHGFDHGFIVTFESAGDRNYYVGRPLVNDPRYYDALHDEFKSFVGPHLVPGPEGVLVFDFAA
ncbi:MAG: Stress responsive Barrel Domain-containing protein [Cryobacterium sp.]|nr:Stress responsive Barrel Domain-containing protein [Cryobacterium sp.]